ncbi:MAG: transposase [Candidatus Sericytochromatia bacterium]
MDQTIVGLMVHYRRFWCVKGEEVKVAYQKDRKFDYLWLIGEVKTGELEAYWTPCVNKGVSQNIINDISKKYENNHLIILMDRAGWHNIENKPSNISFINFPPCSPELNSIERLNQEVKKPVANKSYLKLEDKTAIIDCELEKFFNFPEKVKSTISYPWLISQIDKIYEFIYSK